MRGVSNYSRKKRFLNPRGTRPGGGKVPEKPEKNRKSLVGKKLEHQKSAIRPTKNGEGAPARKFLVFEGRLNTWKKPHVP